MLMNLVSRIITLAFSVALLLVGSGGATFSDATSIDLRPPSGSPMIRLPGHIIPALKQARRIKSAPNAGEQPLTITLVLRRDNQKGFEHLLHALYNPKSKQFHHFLTQEQIADRFGPSRQDYDAVLHYLESNAFKIVQGSRNRMTITARATRARVERAFEIDLANYRIGKRTFYANDRAPALPASIAPHVQAVVGLSNLARPVHVGSSEILSQFPPQNNGTVAYTCYLASQLEDTVGGFSQVGGAFKIDTAPLDRATGFAVTLLQYQCAADELNLVAAYAASLNADPIQPGQGQTIGLLEFDNFHTSDVQNFLNLIGYGSLIGNLSEVDVGGSAGAPGSGESEVLLDIDAVMSTAPGAKVVVYDGPFQGRGSFQTMFNAMINGGVNVISNSWAYCEDQTDAADLSSLDQVLANAAAAGITVVTGAGDHGSTCLDGSPNTVSVPADSPHITAVGGTTAKPGILGTYGSETWWDGTNATPPTGQGGFGLSRVFSRPSYQNGLNASAQRSVPDVTAPADPDQGHLICQADAGGCPTNLLYGGTSVAAPIWAAFAASLNQALGRNLGFLNPLLYPLAGTAAFHSATSMGTDFTHVGLGSPDVAQLKMALANQTAGSAVLANSTVTGFPFLVQDDGVSQAGVAVMLFDSNYNPVSGQNVTLSANSGSHAVITTVNGTTNQSSGAALFTVTDTVPEAVTLTASTGSGTLPQTATITFVSPPAASGGISAKPTSVTANGISTTSITVTLKDAKGSPSPGKLIGLSQGNGASQVSGTSGMTGSGGTVTFIATDKVQESVTYTATDITDGNLPVPGSAPVDFTNATSAPPCNIAVPTPASGYALTTFASGFIYDSGNCVGPVGLAFGSQGNLYVGDYQSGALYKFGQQGGAADAGHEVGIPWKVAGLTGMVFTKDGSFYAAGKLGPFCADLSNIGQFNPANGAAIRTNISSPGCPTALAVDPISGDLFVSNGAINRISNFATGQGTLTAYSNPGAADGLTFGSDGTLYTAGESNNTIYSITGTNSISPGIATVVTTLPGGPDGIALESNSSAPGHPILYVNRNDGTLSRIDTSVSPPAITNIFTGGSRGDFVTVGPDGCLYATQTDRVIKVTNADGTCSFAPISVTPLVVLSPTVVSPSPVQSSPLTLTATLENMPTPAGIQINLAVVGANPGLYTGTTDANGSVTFTYRGTYSGLDQVTAIANPGASQLLSNVVNVTWTAGPHTTFIGTNQSPAAGTTSQPVTLIGTLVDVSVSPQIGLAGQTLNFSLAGQKCSAATDGSGTATCSVNPNAVAGTYPLTVSFAGNSSFAASNASKRFDLSSPVPTPTPTPTPSPTPAPSERTHVMIVPPIVHFSARVGRTSRPREVIVFNRGPGGLRIDNIAISGPFEIRDSSCTGTIGSFRRCTVSLTFRAQVEGKAHGSLIFTDDAGDGTQIVRLVGSGVPADRDDPDSGTDID